MEAWSGRYLYKYARTRPKNKERRVRRLSNGKADGSNDQNSGEKGDSKNRLPEPRTTKLKLSPVSTGFFVE